MGLETINNGVIKYSEDIKRGEITLDKVLDRIWASYFAKPKVPESSFLALCRKHDPDFAPISSKEERQARARLTERVREEYRKMAIHVHNAIDDGLLKQADGKIQRHHLILFRGCSLDEQEQLAQKIVNGGNEAAGKIFAERVLDKKDDILALLDMDDVHLVDNLFKYMDELALVKEMQKYKDLGYTQEQQKAFNELFEHMGELENLFMRTDMISSYYYANYPCERLQMSADEALVFYEEMQALAHQYGEGLENSYDDSEDGLAEDDKRLNGPTLEFATNYSGLRGFALTVLDQKLLDYVRGYGAKDLASCTWAREDGREGTTAKVIDLLNSGEMIFVNIPGEGIKALRNGGTGFADCKVVEATDDEVRQHMIRAVEKGVSRVDAANPFFLAKFTGSSQYKQMAAQHKAAKKLMKELEFPLSPEKYQEAKETIVALQQSTATYLEYKSNQDLDKRDGMLVGRTANERRRLAAAQDAVRLAETLDFLVQYQQNREEAIRYMENQRKAREDELAAKLRAMSEAGKAAKTYEEDELGKATAEELKPKADLYKDMPKCLPSDAGPAVENLQKMLPAAVEQLVKFIGTKLVIGENTSRFTKESMAKVVLLDCVLRERVGNTKPGNEGNVVAGTVEKALNNGTLDYRKLAKSPQFNALVGKLTPARVEAFLMNGESRTGVFDSVVLGILAPVKAKGMDNQPVPQTQIGMNQPQAQSQPPKAAAPSVGSIGG